MLKYDNTVSSQVDGKPIYGAQVTVYTADTDTPALATIFADEAGTTPLSQPILTDQLGYFAFYIGDGKYNIRVMTGAVEISRTNITMVDTLQLKQRALIVPVNEDGGTLPPADQRQNKLLGFDSGGNPTMAVPNSFEGPTGPANSTYTTLTTLKAAPLTNRSYILADGVRPAQTYAYVTGDFTGLADDDYIVKLDAVALTTGALVREEDRVLVTKFMTPQGVANARLRLNTYDATNAFNLAFSVAQATARTVFVPDGSYLVGNLTFGQQNTGGQSVAPLGLIGQSKAATLLKAKPGLTGTLLQSWSVAGATFRDFSMDTSGTTAVAWDARWFFAGPSTQNVIEHIIVTVHNNFTDGQTAHVNWDDMNDTYPCGVTVRPGGMTDYSNCYISMVQSGGLSAMSCCIWTGGFLRFGCQVGEITDSWGHGYEFAANCLNHVTITGGYPYKNPYFGAIAWSQDFTQNGNGVRSLIINSTELNTAVGTGGCYFELNLLGSLILNGVEHIGNAVNFFGPRSRGAGVSRALVVINGGTHDGQLVLNDVTPGQSLPGGLNTGSGIEIEAKGFMNVATSEMVTKNRGGPFEPVIRGSTTVGTYTRGSATYGRINRVGNVAHFKLRIDWSGHTAPATDSAIVTGFPLDRDTDGIESAVLEFADPNFAGARASFSGNQIVFYKPDNSLVMLASSGSVIVSGFYSVKA